MDKIIIIGCPGSGKSTFAQALHQKTGIPLYHLDMMYWNADKTTVEKSIFYARLTEVLKRDRWIIDGNYRSTLALRFEAANQIIFLDYPPDICLAGVKARMGIPRSDMPWIETEEDPEFMAYIRAFQGDNRNEILRYIASYPHKKIHIFTNRSQADAFLKIL